MDDKTADFDLLTAKEVADILKMNPQVILRKLQAGTIPGYKLGKDWRVSRTQLLDWLEKHSNQRQKYPDMYVGQFFKSDGTLKSIPAHRKKRVAVLEVLLKNFELNRVYEEKEVNDIIMRFHSDFCTIRREFIMEKMMSRSEGKYRVNGSYVSRYAFRPSS